jgi:hypothetical protein
MACGFVQDIVKAIRADEIARIETDKGEFEVINRGL